MKIRRVTNKEIDVQKWNTTVQQAPNGLIYAFAEYLTVMCEGWDALVLGDYECVMPLTHRKKFGIPYLYQPPFIQQSGIFGKTNKEIVSAFISEAQSHFAFAEIHLNFLNQTNPVVSKNNQVLLLSKDHQTLKTAYSEYTARKIKQAEKKIIQYLPLESNINISAYIQLFGKNTPHVREKTYKKLNLFFEQNPDLSFSRGLYLDGELAASVSGLIGKGRMHLLTLTTHNRKKFSFAAHTLIDQLIKEFSNQQILLDFEGSDIPGVFAFNEGFGAVNQPYFFKRWNDLPWPLKYLKRGVSV